jgi:hypothetical protein
MVKGTREKKTIEEPKQIVDNDISSLLTETDIPLSERKHYGIYWKIINQVAKENRKLTVLVDLIKLSKMLEKKETLKIKTVYPSFEKCIQQLAKNKDPKIFDNPEIVKFGDREIKRNPLFDKFKEENIRLRVSNSQLYIEKITDKPLA